MSKTILRSAILVAASVLMGRAVVAQISPAATDQEKIAADLANPLAPITTLALQYRAEFGSGPDDDLRHLLRLGPSVFTPFPDQSAGLLRTIVPFASRTFPVAATGMGDISLIPYYVPDVTAATFLGYGAAFGLPTATHEALGSGKWTAGPALLFARTGQPVTFGGLLQHIWSFAGDGNRADVNVSTIQPFLTYLLGGGWSATIISESTFNWYAEEDGWTIPVNLGIFKVVSLGGRYFNLGVVGVYYVQAPTASPEQEVRLNLTYVIR